MTKKRIADLLKEELEKPAAEGADRGPSENSDQGAGAENRDRKRPSTQTETAGAKAASTKASTGKMSTGKTSTAKASSTKPSTAKSSTTKSASSAPAAQKTSATKAKPAAADTNAVEFTDKIAELGAALNRSAEQISALQEDIATHQSRIFELKDSLQKSESDRTKKDSTIAKLASELDEAKQTILKLTAAQEKAKQQAEQAKPDPTAAKKPEDKPPARQSLSLRQPYPSYKSIPEYAIQRGTPEGGQNNSMLSDDDIGWVD